MGCWWDSNAIWNLPSDELNKIYYRMKVQLDELDESSRNYEIFEHLVEKQVKTWLLDSYII